MSPTERTLALMKSRGWTAGVVEKWVPGAFIRKDLFNIIDIIAITGTEIVGVQSCGEAFADHLKKITLENASVASKWIASGGRLILVGWRPKKVKRGGIAIRYEARERELFTFDMGAENMRTPEKQVAELLKRGRTPDQIRAVAIARDDQKLLEYIKKVNLAPAVEDLI